MLKLILGEELPSEGTVWLSPGARIGYMDQELEELDPNIPVIDEALSVVEYRSPELVTKARTILGCFLFTRDDVEKPIKVLSPGERKRVCLIKLLMSDLNVLILDEPTEHLDLLSREKLEEDVYKRQAKAKARAFDVAIIELIVLNLLSALGFAGKELLVAGIALCFASLLIIYAVTFYLLEEK